MTEAGTRPVSPVQVRIDPSSLCSLSKNNEDILVSLIIDNFLYTIHYTVTNGLYIRNKELNLQTSTL